MTRFVQPDFPRTHEGAVRLARAYARTRSALAHLFSPAGMVALLVAGGVAAVLAVAEQLATALTDGHLLVLWIALWAIVFGLMAHFADTLRARLAQWRLQLQQRRARAASRAADERTWAAALADPRLMAELESALLRAQQHAQARGAPVPTWPFAGARRHRAGGEIQQRY